MSLNVSVSEVVGANDEPKGSPEDSKRTNQNSADR